MWWTYSMPCPGEVPHSIATLWQLSEWGGWVHPHTLHQQEEAGAHLVYANCPTSSLQEKMLQVMLCHCPVNTQQRITVSVFIYDCCQKILSRWFKLAYINVRIKVQFMSRVKNHGRRLHVQCGNTACVVWKMATELENKMQEDRQI